MKEYICRKEVSGGIGLRVEYTPIKELVRCKDCKNRKMVLPNTAMSKLDAEPYCKILRNKVDDDFFCKSGEPR